MKALLRLSITLCLASCSALDLNQRKPEGIDFSGHWVLNLLLSDGATENSAPPNSVRARDQIKTEGMASADLLFGRFLSFPEGRTIANFLFGRFLSFPKGKVSADFLFGRFLSFPKGRNIAHFLFGRFSRSLRAK